MNPLRQFFALANCARFRSASSPWFLVSLAVVISLCGSARVALAGKDVGSAWVVDKTPYGITIQWSTGEDYSWCYTGMYNQYGEVKACFKVHGTKGSPCGKNGDSRSTEGL